MAPPPLRAPSGQDCAFQRWESKRVGCAQQNDDDIVLLWVYIRILIACWSRHVAILLFKVKRRANDLRLYMFGAVHMTVARLAAAVHGGRLGVAVVSGRARG